MNICNGSLPHIYKYFARDRSAFIHNYFKLLANLKLLLVKNVLIPKKENSLAIVNTLKTALDRISGICHLLQLQTLITNSFNQLWVTNAHLQYLIDFLFTTSLPITLD